jgi:autophagy-related protein 17
LDAILDSLGAQLVPPDFHQASSESSIFGSPQSDKEPPLKLMPIRIPNGTGETLRGQVQSKRSDRKTWKTLRDFVDEVAIEDVLESIEEDRTALDVSPHRIHSLLISKLTVYAGYLGKD